jgi:hypothetical protein
MYMPTTESDTVDPFVFRTSNKARIATIATQLEEHWEHQKPKMKSYFLMFHDDGGWTAYC